MSKNNYTGMWQFQPYKTWKGNSRYSVMPTMSRPNVNGINNANAHDYIGPDRKARPLKIWRRQLQPSLTSGRSAATVGLAERPGGTSVRSDNKKCCDDASGGSLYITTDLTNPKPPSATIYPAVPGDKIQNNGYVAFADPDYDIQTGIYNTTCVACNPENNVIKSGVTLLSKAYYSNNRAYLQSRNMRYDQKQTLSPHHGIIYTTGSGANVEVLYPTDTNKGPQVFNTNTCPKAHGGPPNCSITTIYKPNNRGFSTEGAVSSSTRLEKLKVNTCLLYTSPSPRD